MKRIYVVILLIFFVLLPAKNYAQEVFYAEAGFGGGGAFSLGDANGILFKNLQPFGSVFFKYKFNGYLELKANLEGGYVGVSDIAGIKEKSKTIGCQVMGEFNFFNWAVKRYEEHYSWVAPYITLGAGMVYFDGQAAFTVPMGLGVKFKLHDRVNVGAFWTVSKVMSDNFDGIDNPLGLNAGFWNNRDWYSSAQIYISFNFIKICAPCRNGNVSF